MPARTDSIATTMANWLSKFEHALAERDEILLKTLFHRDSHWRDVLALTWRIATFNSRTTIASELRKHDHLRPAGFKLAPGRTPPRHVTRAGVESIEAIFIFETAEARGNGVLRLTPDPDSGDTLRAWTLLPHSMRSRGTRRGLAGRGP